MVTLSNQIGEMRTASGTPCGASASVVVVTVRDMGNGVLRVERAACLDDADLALRSSACFLDHWLPVAFPAPPAIEDCARAALGLLGLPSRLFAAGRCRSAADDVTELCLW